MTTKLCSVKMHHSREHIELVLQETCVQHKNVDSMRRDLKQERVEPLKVRIPREDPQGVSPLAADKPVVIRQS